MKGEAGLVRSFADNQRGNGRVLAPIGSSTGAGARNRALGIEPERVDASTDLPASREYRDIPYKTLMRLNQYVETPISSSIWSE